MPSIFLSEELYRIPVPLQNSWPFVEASWLDITPEFMPSLGQEFHSMDVKRQLDFCNTTLRFHMHQANWHGRWRRQLVENRKWKLSNPPNGVPELSLVTSGLFIVRAVYGEMFVYWNLVYTLLTLIFCVFFSTTTYIAVMEDGPIFTGWRTLDIANQDVDKIQLSTRTVHARLSFRAASFPSFRFTVIYTRYVRGLIVFKRKYSEQVRYRGLTNFTGQFDALKFENWIRGVILNAMTVPEGSAWNLRHLTLT